VTTRDEWAVLIGAADASLVLPVRPRGASIELTGPLTMLDVLPLGDISCVAVVQDGAGGRWVTPLVVRGSRVDRARAGDAVAVDLVSLLMHSSARVGAFSVTHWAGHVVTGEEPVTVDQTNDSVIVGGAAVVKWSVRAPAVGEPGSPAAARISALAEHHFDAMPQPWGLVTWNDGVHDIAIATVAAYLSNAEDGWDWAVRDVGAYALGRRADLPLDAARQLGAMAAHMHAALSDAGIERATVEQVTTWRERGFTDLDEALRCVEGPELARLAARAPRIRAVLESLRDTADTPLIDVHGDFHIGQILQYGDSPQYAVTDFDGSPVLSATERVAKQPAAVDAVSMIASLDHVGRVVIKRVDGADPGLVRSWIVAAQQTFLDTYRETLGEQAYSELVDERLFTPLRFQQELREYIYAARHLPHWSYVPDMALQDLLPDEE
jgi:maltokinase